MTSSANRYPEMPDPASVHLWRTDPDYELVWHDLDGDFAVYNPKSGHTHVLDVVGGTVLQLIGVEGRTMPSIVDALAQFLDLPATDELAATAARMVRWLDEEGLIEPGETDAG